VIEGIEGIELIVIETMSVKEDTGIATGSGIVSETGMMKREGGLIATVGGMMREMIPKT
jgi:hypothetical protein